MKVNQEETDTKQNNRYFRLSHGEDCIEAKMRLLWGETEFTLLQYEKSWSMISLSVIAHKTIFRQTVGFHLNPTLIQPPVPRLIISPEAHPALHPKPACCVRPRHAWGVLAGIHPRSSASCSPRASTGALLACPPGACTLSPQPLTTTLPEC